MLFQQYFFSITNNTSEKIDQFLQLMGIFKVLNMES